MQKSLKHQRKELDSVSKFWLKFFRTLVAFEAVNYLIHLHGWSLLTAEAYVRFRSLVPVPDYDQMLITPKYMAYTDAFMEYVMIGALLAPPLAVLWAVGIIRRFLKGEKRKRSVVLTSTALIIVYLLQHFGSGPSQFFSELLLGRGPPYGVGTFMYSIIRVMAYFAVIQLFIDPDMLSRQNNKQIRNQR